MKSTSWRGGYLKGCFDLFANKRTFLSLYELRSRVREEIRNRKEMSSENTSY